MLLLLLWPDGEASSWSLSEPSATLGLVAGAGLAVLAGLALGLAVSCSQSSVSPTNLPFCWVLASWAHSWDARDEDMLLWVQNVAL